MDSTGLALLGGPRTVRFRSIAFLGLVVHRTQSTQARQRMPRVAPWLALAAVAIHAAGFAYLQLSPPNNGGAIFRPRDLAPQLHAAIPLVVAASRLPYRHCASL